ncbi:MAG: hypothetical protein LBQ49_01940 [Rickettsiales bacterium]|nr:hypothetical protein [Rickettsiales bacterium]
MLKVIKKVPYLVYMILAKPERFFKKIVVDGSLEESIIKAFIYGLCGGVALLVLDLIFGGGVAFSSVFMKLIVYPVVAVGILFAFAGLMMMFSEIAGGSRDWELAVKGVSSIFFMYPVILVLDSFAFNCTSLILISILVDGYVLFLLYNIAYHCMDGKKWIVLGIIAAALVVMVMVYASDYSFSWLAAKNYDAALACIS